MQYLTPERVTLRYEMPLAEVVNDFFDEMKSRSKGYASMEYSFIEARVQDLVRLDVKINGELAEPLATICHRCARRALCVPCSLCLQATASSRSCWPWSATGARIARAARPCSLHRRWSLCMCAGTQRQRIAAQAAQRCTCQRPQEALP
jgi:Elongation factor G C-terminus